MNVMRTINAKSTYTIATKILNKRLSYFKCIKLDITTNDFTQAIMSATVSVKAPNSRYATKIVNTVKLSNINNICDKVLYSMICVVLFAIVLK